MLNYTLDQEIHKGERFLVVHLSEGQNAIKRHLYPNTLYACTHGNERELIAFLVNEESKFLSLPSSKMETAPCNKIRIKASRSWEAMRRLGASGKLYLKGSRVVVDPFTLLHLELLAAHLPDGSLQVKGIWRSKETSGKMEEVDFLFPEAPAWMIEKGIMRRFAEDIGGKWLHMTCPPSCLTGAKKEQFISFFEDELEGSVKAIWQDNASSSPDPLPLLVLHDRTGAFGNLWMDYGVQGKIGFDEVTSPKWRFKEKERAWEKDLLETGFIKKRVGESNYYCPLDQVAKSLTFLLEIGWKVFDYRNRQVVRQGAEEMFLSRNRDAFLVAGKIAYDTHTAQLSDVMGAFNRRERFIDLSPHHVGLIDVEEGRLANLASEEVVREGVKVKACHIGLLEEVFQTTELPLSLRPTPTLGPPHLKFCGQLHAYQQLGVDWLLFLYTSGFHGLLADEMGLGKTVQVLGFCAHLNTDLPTLIVVPTSLLFNWRLEFEKFMPSESLYLHAGSERVVSKEGLIDKKWILTSYAMLRQDASLLQSVEYECVILDEGQWIKNPESQTARCAYDLKGRFRLVMTGTPIENRWEDLWSLFHFLMPELLGEKKSFSSSMLAAQADGRHLQQLKKKLRPFILRRRKEEVAEQLPAKQEQVIWVEMGEAQRAVYEEWQVSSRSRIISKVREEGVSAHRMEILEAILRLRQICCHPQLVDGSLQEAVSGKLEQMIDDMEAVIGEGRKALVYSQFTDMLHLIEKKVQEKNWSYVYLDGSTKNREEVVQRFQNDPSVSLFLISLKAGGVGLNLTAADYVFLYDPWWNEAVELQAIDRAHRLGRTSAVIARRYVTLFSIEEKIMSLKKHKASLSLGLLEDAKTPVNFSLEELYELLS